MIVYVHPEGGAELRGEFLPFGPSGRTIRQATAREVRLVAEVMEPVEAATAKTPLIVKRSPQIKTRKRALWPPLRGEAP